MLDINIPRFAYNDTPILENIHLRLETAKCYGVVGLNGTGKTTLFKLISGIEKEPQATIHLNTVPLQFKQVAYIDTDLFLYPKLLAAEFLNVFPQTNPLFRQQELAAIFRLPLDQFASEFSTGMKKKLFLMAHLKQDKPVFILDEPFNGLDLETNQLLEVIIKVLAQRGKTVLISSHILDPLLHVCHNIHLLRHGTIDQTYTPDTYHHIQEDLFGAYLRETEKELLNCF